MKKARDEIIPLQLIVSLKIKFYVVLGEINFELAQACIRAMLQINLFFLDFSDAYRIAEMPSVVGQHSADAPLRLRRDSFVIYSYFALDAHMYYRTPG